MCFKCDSFVSESQCSESKYSGSLKTISVQSGGTLILGSKTPGNPSIVHHQHESKAGQRECLQEQKAARGHRAKPHSMTILLAASVMVYCIIQHCHPHPETTPVKLRFYFFIFALIKVRHHQSICLIAESRVAQALMLTESVKDNC